MGTGAAAMISPVPTPKAVRPRMRPDFSVELANFSIESGALADGPLKLANACTSLLAHGPYPALVADRLPRNKRILPVIWLKYFLRRSEARGGDRKFLFPGRVGMRRERWS